MISKAQREYLKSKAWFLSVSKEVERQVKQLPRPADDAPEEENVAFCKLWDEIEAQAGYWEAFKERKDAGDALIAWAYEQTKKMPGYQANKSDIDKVFQHKPSREALIDLALRLDI